MCSSRMDLYHGPRGRLVGPLAARMVVGIREMVQSVERDLGTRMHRTTWIVLSLADLLVKGYEGSLVKLYAQ